MIIKEIFSKFQDNSRTNCTFLEFQEFSRTKVIFQDFSRYANPGSHNICLSAKLDLVTPIFGLSRSLHSISQRYQEFHLFDEICMS